MVMLVLVLGLMPIPGLALISTTSYTSACTNIATPVSYYPFVSYPAAALRRELPPLSHHHDGGPLWPAAGRHLRDVALGSGLLSPPGASLPRPAPLVGRAARRTPTIAGLCVDNFLLQDAALQGLCAPLRGGLYPRSGRHGAALAFLGLGAAGRRVSLHVGGAAVTSLVPSKLVKKMLWPAGSCPGAACGAAEAADGPNGFLCTCSSLLGPAQCAVFALTAVKPSSGACIFGDVMMVLQPAALPLRAAGGVALEEVGLRVPSSPLSSLPSSPCSVVHSPPGVAFGPSQQYLCSITTCVAMPLMPQSLGMLKPWVLLIQSGPPSSGDAYAGKAGTTGLLSGLRKPVGTVYPTPSWSVYGNVCITGRVCLSSAWGSRFQGSCYALPMAMSSNGFHLIDYSLLRRRRRPLDGGCRALKLMTLFFSGSCACLQRFFGMSSAFVVATMGMVLLMENFGQGLYVDSLALLWSFAVGAVFHTVARLLGYQLPPSFSGWLVSGGRELVMIFSSCPGISAALLFWGVLGWQFHSAVAVCLSCNGNVPNCPGDATCPMALALATNLAVMAGGEAVANKVLDMGSGGAPILPLTWLQVLRPSILDALVTVARRAPVGTPQGIRDMSVKEILDALIAGSTSHMDARLELARRVTDPAISSADKTQIKVVCEVLPKASAEGEPHASRSNRMGNAGALQYVFALAMRIVRYLADPTRVSIAGGSSETQGSSSTAATLASIELKRPKSLHDFMHSLTIWQSILSAVGLASAVVLGPFLSDVVHTPMADYGWEVALEHFLLYLQKIDSGCGWALATATSQGSQDTFLHRAIKAAPAPARDTLTPKRPGADPSVGKAEGVKVKFNGKSSSDPNARPCVAFNTGSEHRRLNPDGSCPFRHVCDQWVSDKGPAGKCQMAHARVACTNPLKVADKVE